MTSIVKLPNNEYYLMSTRPSERSDNNFQFMSDPKRDLIAFSNVKVPKELRGKRLMIRIIPIEDESEG
jgi:hypothetical protein|tara:strand:- start:1854 stop:2057 length:204 start_codon:yes stop_codon:yes gene_type:complete